MNTQISPIQALQNLYSAARRAQMTADDHDIIKSSATIINEILKSYEESNSLSKQNIESEQ